LSEISVVAGPASFDLAHNVAKTLGMPLSVARLRVFSDGESSLKLDKVGKKCVIIQSTHPPTDTHVLQLLMMAKKFTDEGVQNICAIVPYLAYSRQDRAFLEGEVVSIAVLAKLFESVGIKHIITVDIHSKLAMSHFKSIQNVASVSLLAQYASKLKLHDPIAISPDAGGANRARCFAQSLNIDMIAMKKSRNKISGEVSIEEEFSPDISGRDVILIDDMISSGESLIKTSEVLRKKRVGKIYAMCAHALLIRDAAQKIRAAGIQDIISTNSVPSRYSKVDVGSEIVSALRDYY
jgi:ribose-phosphate pyrophosphokinase